MRHALPLALIAAAASACSDGDRDRSEGQTSFESAPPSGAGNLTEGDAGGGAGTPGAQAPPQHSSSRTVEETDVYRLEGNRLYYLNAYRGLMVFDVTDPDHPALLGRSAIFGDPVDMIVRNGMAIVVVGNWLGTGDDGQPFHVSIVRGFDATDPAHIRVLGDAKLGGWVLDDRVVGDVIYAVSADSGQVYGWDASTTAPRPSVVVASVSFAGGVIAPVDHVVLDGWSGVFNVTPSSILLAANQAAGNAVHSSLRYLDISDPAGQIVSRGTITVDGGVNGWGPDNGRWNLDFADGKTAHVLAQTGSYIAGYTLSTVDFSNPDHPVLASALPITGTAWTVAARFDTNRLYLSPYGPYTYDGGTTPLQVYDLTDPAAPHLAGTASLSGSVWNILPAPNQRLFALGNATVAQRGDPVSLQYLDVSNPSAPQLFGTSTFGSGWAWTPASGTFKAFTMDEGRGLVVLPFAGWDWVGRGYNNGLQLIEFTPSGVTTAGAARTKGWVERGIFVGNRLLSLSYQSLAVVDYTAPMAPVVVNEVALARNVVTALPAGERIAEVSSDWWGNDTTTSEVRVLPIGAADETADTAAPVPAVTVAGVNAQVFGNGRFAYIVTTISSDVPCSDTSTGCFLPANQVQVVDLASGAPVLRGKLALPADVGRGYGWAADVFAWGGFWWWDWWGGASVVQIGGDALAFRYWVPDGDSGGNGTNRLIVADLADPDAPRSASVDIDVGGTGWWGNLRAAGDTLYATHYQWVDDPHGRNPWVRYYLDQIDLSDRARPRVAAQVNVPGLMVGADASDPSIVYTVDYRWAVDTNPVNDLDVVQIRGGRARLLSHTPLPGYVGTTLLRGAHAYVSTEVAVPSSGSGVGQRVDLHAIDISDPRHPRDRIASTSGWGWLLTVVGDRALVTSGWGGENAIDVYQLRDDQPPQFRQTIRARSWWVNGVARQDDTLFLSSGYWGVQSVPLQ